MVHWQGRLVWVTVVVFLYMAEAELLAELELVVRLVLVLVHVLQEVWSQGQWEWMRKIGVDHNTDGYKAWKFYCPESKKVIISERANFDEHFFIN